MSPEAFKARLREERNISGIFNWLVLSFVRLKLRSDDDTAVHQTPLNHCSASIYANSSSLRIGVVIINLRLRFERFVAPYFDLLFC